MPTNPFTGYTDYGIGRVLEAFEVGFRSRGQLEDMNRLKSILLRQRCENRTGS